MLAMKRATRSPVCVPATLALACVFLLNIAAEDAGKMENVTIQGTAFSPDTLQIAVGDTVVWTNADDRDYTVIATDGSFSSGNISSGKMYEHRFDKPGTFPYGCKYHPRMKGTIIVAAK